jgi:hypothetical protein
MSRTEFARIRLSPDEYQQLAQAANHFDLNISDVARSILMHGLTRAIRTNNLPPPPPEPLKKRRMAKTQQQETTRQFEID